jgi:hypothetical protein
LDSFYFRLHKFKSGLATGACLFIFITTSCISNVAREIDVGDADLLPRQIAIEYIGIHATVSEKGIIFNKGQEPYRFEDTRVKILRGDDNWYVLQIYVREKSADKHYRNHKDIYVHNDNAEEIAKKLFVAFISLGSKPDY